MSSKKMPKLRIGDLEANLAIVQGGMGVGISLSGLASAVANEGIGVNIMVALSDFDDLIEVSVDEGADLVFLGAGLALRNPIISSRDTSRKATTKVVPIVSSARAAKIIFKYWGKNYNHVPDAVVIEGPLAGGLRVH